MDRMSAPTLHPACLPPGTVVGPWRVEGWSGCGVYGAVYRAVAVGAEHAGPVALKVAMHPEDPRFAREARLLSGVDHPHVPRLLGHGEWQPEEGGPRYPFVAMEWVDGVPLYDWARLHPATGEQVLRWLTQLASALAALHAQEFVHRDVKGDNILVRRADGCAVLTDFGTGIYPGAATLTPALWFPGTPAYRSPESWLFELQFSRDATARYHARPADDLYALGVTGCRLLTGEYPEPGEPLQDEQGTWRMEVIHPPALLSEPRVEPRLRGLILRLLSVRPEQRGTAEQWVRDLEHVAASRTPSQSPPSAPAKAQRTRQRSGAEACPEVRVPSRSHRPLLGLVTVAGLLALWGIWSMARTSEVSARLARIGAASTEGPEAEPVGLGEVAATAALGDAPPPFNSEVMGADTPPEPLPTQARPDAKGRCPRARQVALNGGCWRRLTTDHEECEDLQGYLFQGACYVPIVPHGRAPTSTPTKPQ